MRVLFGSGQEAALSSADQDRTRVRDSPMLCGRFREGLVISGCNPQSKLSYLWFAFLEALPIRA